MTKEKWVKIYNIEYDYSCAVMYASCMGCVNPENWTKVREINLKFVKAMDEATEVYNRENKVK